MQPSPRQCGRAKPPARQANHPREVCDLRALDPFIVTLALKRSCAKKRSLPAFSTRTPLSRSPCKKISLSFFPKLRPAPSIPPHAEGRTRRHDTLGAGRDGREGAGRRLAPARTEKSCGPGAPVPALNLRRRRHVSQVTGAREPVPGESTKDTVKTIAQGRPVIPAEPVVTAACIFFRTRATGISRCPAFPAPSVMGERP